MPEIDIDFNYEAMRQLVQVERDWVPHSAGTSLYLRPTMIAVDEALGVHAAHSYLYYIICSPSGAYYKAGLAPIRIRVEDKYVRAVRGGTGSAKTGGNYACSILAGAEAEKEGYSQVLWLDGEHLKYVQEVGAMNMMFLIDGKLVTAPLHDTILPGITRRSVMTLAREMGVEVEERPISVDELIAAGEKRQADRSIRHRHRGSRLPRRRACISRQAYHDRRQVRKQRHRRTDHEALQHSHRFAVGQD